MCGIAGIYAYHYAANAVDRTELRAIRDHMTARGPDGAGDWFASDNRIGLAHRRLAVIAPGPQASQPMISANGQAVITFNGTITNHDTLRDDLIQRGYTFKTRSDTEVLLNLYLDRGDAFVAALRGMFALALWDIKAKRLFLARDPFGIKPLYYSDDGWTFRFASQVKALLAGGALSREIDPAGITGFHLFGSVPEPFTRHRSIRCLPAGATLSVDPIGATAPQKFYQPNTFNPWGLTPNRNTSDVTEEIHSALRHSLKGHLIGEAPLGAFLSGGIDSAAIVGLMRDVSTHDISTVTIGFEAQRGTRLDERAAAARVASHYATHHSSHLITQAELEADLPYILAAMDQPSIDGINMWFAAKAARARGLKVMLAGIGGDELFGGYPSFRQIPKIVAAGWLPSRVPGLGRLSRVLAEPLLRKSNINPKTAGMIEYGGSFAGAYLLRRGLYMPWELPKILGRDLAREGLRRLRPLELIGRITPPSGALPFQRISLFEQSLYMRNQLLRDADWAAMAHGIELRVPLADIDVAAAVSCNIPYVACHGKKLLASVPISRPRDAGIKPGKIGFVAPSTIPPVSGNLTFGGATNRHWAQQIHAQVSNVA